MYRIYTPMRSLQPIENEFLEQKLDFTPDQLEAAREIPLEVRVGYSWSIAQNRGEGPQKMPRLGRKWISPDFKGSNLRSTWNS